MADETTTTPEAVPDPDTGALVPPSAPNPPAELVWLRAGTGVAHEVPVGSEAHKRLLENGAQPIDGPTPEECEVTDFAMLEKAKADKKTR